MSLLDHMNIVQVQDGYEDKKRLAIVMEMYPIRVLEWTRMDLQCFLCDLFEPKKNWQSVTPNNTSSVACGAEPSSQKLFGTS